MARIARAAGIAAVVAVALFCALLLAVRFVVFPRVGDYRDELAGVLSRQLQQPVDIDRLATGWDGWNPKLVLRGLRVRDGADAAARPLLELPQVEMVVAWTSLPYLDLRLKSLVLERPQLALRRDSAGILHFAGMAFDPSLVANDAPLADWALRQPHIAVHDGRVAWNDDLRNAPQLVLDHVQFRFESRFGRHRFGLHATPPAALGAPIDVRGEFRRGAAGPRPTASGRLYVLLEDADLAAASAWLPLPLAITRGNGALRLWLDFVDGAPTGAVADLDLTGVKARLEPGLPVLDLARLSGRVGWTEAPPRRELHTRALAFVTAAGQRLEPTDLKLTLDVATGNSAATGLVEFDRLQLDPLRDLAAYLPLPDDARAALARYAPRGTLTRGRFLWEGHANAPEIYSAAAEFSGLGIAAQDDMPGVEGMTGRVEMTQATGDLKLASRNGALLLPRVFVEPIRFDTLSGAASWTRTADRTAVEIERLEFANRDAAGRAAGKFRTVPDGPGEIDLEARLTRANAAQVHRYLPLAVAPAVRDWMRSALTAGTSSDVKLKLAGDLARFPFGDGKSGQFTVTAKVRDAGIDYVEGWPPLSDADGEVGISGTRLTVEATRARIAGVPLGTLRAAIDDLRAEYPLLAIDGEAAGPTGDFLRFVATSPVADWIGHATDTAQATGTGQLRLNLRFPLGDPAANTLSGEYRFVDNELRMVGAPRMSRINGRLAFTESNVSAQDLTLETLGGTARVTVANVGGQLSIVGSGASTLAALRREFDPPYGEMLSGNIDWTVALTAGRDGTAWTAESSLAGTAIDLPAPLGKPAGATIPLKVARRGDPARADEDALTVTYGNTVRLLLQRKLGGAGPRVERALLLLGRAAADPAQRPERPGVWLRGELPTLNFDDWLALQRQPARAAGSGANEEVALAGIDLDVGVLEAFGRRFHDIKVGARRTQDDWRLDLAARELAGSATWSAASADVPNGRFAARLSRLVPPDAGEFAPWKTAADASDRTAPGAANPWPEIDVAAASYVVRGRDVGGLEFIAHPRGAEWLIDRMTLANDAGRVTAQGQWRSGGAQEQTSLEVDVDVQETGRFLARIGYADAIEHAPTRIKGQLAWAGDPSAFDYPTLSGNFRIDVGPGRFTRIEPGIGKLLGVLSLQALPRRITLDFTDVFSDGFAFDDIKGDVRIRNGVLTSDDLRLAGPAAKVDIAGSVDLAAETQQLSVRVQPALSASVSAGAMLLLFANPIVGAAVGAGSLLAQKVLSDPIEQMFSYEYKVTGGWSDPVVTRKDAVVAPAEMPRR